MKPIIGIVTRPDHLESGNQVDVIYSAVRKSIVHYGGIPIGIMPASEIVYDSLKFEDSKSKNDEEWNDILPLLKQCDGFIFQGGDCFYDYDLRIVQYAYTSNIPSLGICLGMQLMGYSQNGAMEFLKEKNMEHYSKHPYVHEINLLPNSLLATILGSTKCKVNSRHHEHIIKTDLKAVGFSNDGIIEAIEDSNKKFFIGVQWHPEDMVAYDKVTEKLWSYFLLKCEEHMYENKRID